jgi:hypothetical protein
MRGVFPVIEREQHETATVRRFIRPKNYIPQPARLLLRKKNVIGRATQKKL